MLSETDLLRIDPNLQQEKVDTAQKVPHGLGIDDFLAIQTKCQKLCEQHYVERRLTDEVTTL